MHKSVNTSMRIMNCSSCPQAEVDAMTYLEVGVKLAQLPLQGRLLRRQLRRHRRHVGLRRQVLYNLAGRLEKAATNAAIATAAAPRAGGCCRCW